MFDKLTPQRWLGKLIGRGKGQQGRRAPRQRPQLLIGLEALEDRLAPSCTRGGPDPLASAPSMVGSPTGDVQPLAVSISGLPASGSVAVGSAVTAQADADGGAGGYEYSWQVLKDGADYASGAGGQFAFVPDDSGTYQVVLNVADCDGRTATATA